MAFNFPDGASNGDTHTASNGVKYRFDGTVWVVDRPSTTTSFEAKYLDATGDDVVSGSAQVKSLLPAGTLSSSQFQDTGITGSLTVDSDVNVAQYIKHTGDVDTFINFTDNRIRFKAGDIGFLDMEKDASTPYPFTVNQGGNRINFRVMDRNTDLLLKTDSEAFNVGLYYAGNKKIETVVGGINVTGHVTASGNISSSANITGNVVNVKTRVKAVGSSLEFAGDTLDFVNGSSTSRFFRGISAGAFEAYHAGNKKLETTSAGIEVLGNVSGSATSTGSFGVINVGGGHFTSASLAAGGSGVSSYTDLTNVPSGIISGSLQLPSGIISGSEQLPSGTISGSEQIHDLNFVSSSTTNTIQVMTSASYATITPVSGTLYIIQG